MLSKSQIKHIQALRKKKDRKEHQQFVIEGRKIVQELLLSNWTIQSIYCSKSFAQKHSTPADAHFVEDYIFEKISTQSNPEGILAIVRMPAPSEPDVAQIRAIALDRIQDPGNLGSIIRIADWYGIEHIICSTDSVDCFNAKSLQASMGSIFRVNVLYRNLADFSAKTAIYVADMEGQDYKEVQPLQKGILLIGNEAQGVGPWLAQKKTVQITIPRKGQAESLNAAIACGILSAHLFG
jgi:RNA methyltransferase, TrmH family